MSTVDWIDTTGREGRMRMSALRPGDFLRWTSDLELDDVELNAGELATVTMVDPRRREVRALTTGAAPLDEGRGLRYGAVTVSLTERILRNDVVAVLHPDDPRLAGRADGVPNSEGAGAGGRRVAARGPSFADQLKAYPQKTPMTRPSDAWLDSEWWIDASVENSIEADFGQKSISPRPRRTIAEALDDAKQGGWTHPRGAIPVAGPGDQWWLIAVGPPANAAPAPSTEAKWSCGHKRVPGHAQCEVCAALYGRKVTSGVRVVGAGAGDGEIERWLCNDCTIAEANGDTSGLDDEREREVNEGIRRLVERDGPLSADWGAEASEDPDESGFKEFSSSRCDACGAGAGSRHRWRQRVRGPDVPAAPAAASPGSWRDCPTCKVVPNHRRRHFDKDAGLGRRVVGQASPQIGDKFEVKHTATPPIRLSPSATDYWIQPGDEIIYTGQSGGWYTVEIGGSEGEIGGGWFQSWIRQGAIVAAGSSSVQATPAPAPATSRQPQVGDRYEIKVATTRFGARPMGVVGDVVEIVGKNGPLYTLLNGTTKWSDHWTFIHQLIDDGDWVLLGATSATMPQRSVTVGPWTDGNVYELLRTMTATSDSGEDCDSLDIGDHPDSGEYFANVEPLAHALSDAVENAINAWPGLQTLSQQAFDDLESACADDSFIWYTWMTLEGHGVGIEDHLYKHNSPLTKQDEQAFVAAIRNDGAVQTAHSELESALQDEAYATCNAIHGEGDDDEAEEAHEDEPEDGDYVIERRHGDRFNVWQIGNRGVSYGPGTARPGFGGSFNTAQGAERAINADMERAGYFPNVWDHNPYGDPQIHDWLTDPNTGADKETGFVPGDLVFMLDGEDEFEYDHVHTWVVEADGDDEDDHELDEFEDWLDRHLRTYSDNGIYWQEDEDADAIRVTREDVTKIMNGEFTGSTWKDDAEEATPYQDPRPFDEFDQPATPDSTAVIDQLARAYAKYNAGTGPIPQPTPEQKALISWPAMDAAGKQRFEGLVWRYEQEERTGRPRMPAQPGSGLRVVGPQPEPYEYTQYPARFAPRRSRLTRTAAGSMLPPMTWTCVVCDNGNNASDDHCAHCGAPKDGAEPDLEEYGFCEQCGGRIWSTDDGENWNHGGSKGDDLDDDHTARPKTAAPPPSPPAEPDEGQTDECADCGSHIHLDEVGNWKHGYDDAEDLDYDYDHPARPRSAEPSTSAVPTKWSCGHKRTPDQTRCTTCAAVYGRNVTSQVQPLPTTPKKVRYKVKSLDVWGGWPDECPDCGGALDPDKHERECPHCGHEHDGPEYTVNNWFDAGETEVDADNNNVDAYTDALIESGHLKPTAKGKVHVDDMGMGDHVQIEDADSGEPLYQLERIDEDDAEQDEADATRSSADPDDDLGSCSVCNGTIEQRGYRWFHLDSEGIGLGHDLDADHQATPTSSSAPKRDSRHDALQGAYDSGRAAKPGTSGRMTYPADPGLADAFNTGNADAHGFGFMKGPARVRKLVDVDAKGFGRWAWRRAAANPMLPPTSNVKLDPPIGAVFETIGAIQDVSGRWLDPKVKIEVIGYDHVGRHANDRVVVASKLGTFRFSYNHFGEAVKRGTFRRTAVVRRSAGVRVMHYSRASGLTQLEPSFYGTGKVNRREQQDDRCPVVYFYRLGTEPEDLIVGSSNGYYEGELPDEAQLLDLNGAPDFVQEAAYRDGLGGMRQAVKNAGFFGFFNSDSSLPNAVAVFYPVPVTEKPRPKKADVREAQRSMAELSQAEIDALVTGPFMEKVQARYGAQPAKAASAPKKAAKK